MYECLVGYPPFYADEPMHTCRKIVNWKRTFVIPSDANVSPAAEDLLRKLMCGHENRLTFEEIQHHPFFNGIDWENLRDVEPPIIPSVKSEEDCQNFDDFDEEKNSHDDTGIERKSDDAFVGYTFRRQDDEKPSLGSLFGGP